VRPLVVFVIDDDPGHAEAMAELVARAGHEPRVFTSGAAAMTAILGGAADVVVTDLAMRDRSGLDVIAAASREESGRPPVVVVTGYGSAEAAPAAIRAGAAAYLVKPLEVEAFRTVLERVGRLARERPARARQPAAKNDGGFPGLVGRSPAMSELFDRIRRVADSNATVLLEGESGTGKELAARAIHLHSARRDGPFLAVNCAALSPGLLESELFGHERGAFTGAHTTRVGRFEAAHGGTLLLDEVGEMPPPLQAKLLRTLEEREVVRVGANHPIHVDVRVIAATNRPLAPLVAAGAFRQDLYYRLNVVRLSVPPLRERAGDVPLLVDALLGSLAREHGRPAPSVEPEAMRRLAAWRWPGNVRELRNCLETLLLTSEGETIREEDLPPEMRGGSVPAPFPSLSMRPLSDVERELIANTLRDLGGNRAQAARALGISARTLYRRIKELGLS
jgi:two-component system response regulator HydG